MSNAPSDPPGEEKDEADPPPVVRPIIPGAPWFRARGGNHAYLPWWGLRHDAPHYPQGFSQ